MYFFSRWFVWFALFALFALFTKKKQALNLPYIQYSHVVYFTCVATGNMIRYADLCFIIDKSGCGLNSGIIPNITGVTNANTPKNSQKKNLSQITATSRHCPTTSCCRAYAFFSSRHSLRYASILDTFSIITLLVSLPWFFVSTSMSSIRTVLGLDPDLDRSFTVRLLFLLMFSTRPSRSSLLFSQAFTYL